MIDDSFKQDLRSVLMSEKGGILLSRLNMEYVSLIGKSIEFDRKLYANLGVFLATLSDTCVLTKYNGEIFVLPIISEKQRALSKLINGQKNKPKCIRGPTNMNYGTRYFPPGTIFSSRAQTNAVQNVTQRGSFDNRNANKENDQHSTSIPKRPVNMDANRMMPQTKNDSNVKSFDIRAKTCAANLIVVESKASDFSTNREQITESVKSEPVAQVEIEKKIIVETQQPIKESSYPETKDPLKKENYDDRYKSNESIEYKKEPMPSFDIRASTSKNKDAIKTVVFDSNNNEIPIPRFEKFDDIETRDDRQSETRDDRQSETSSKPMLTSSNESSSLKCSQSSSPSHIETVAESSVDVSKIISSLEKTSFDTQMTRQTDANYGRAKLVLQRLKTLIGKEDQLYDYLIESMYAHKYSEVLDENWLTYVKNSPDFDVIEINACRKPVVLIALSLEYNEKY